MRSIAVLVLLAGCATPPPAPPLAPAAQSQPQFRAAISAAPGRGSIRGQARLLGKVRVPHGGPIEMPKACEVHAPSLKTRPQFRVGPNGELANVLVAAMPKDGNPPRQPPAKPAVLHMHCVVMDPRIVVLIVGQGVIGRNEESVLHNLHFIPRTNREFVGLPKAGEDQTFAFEKAELGIKAGCDVHPWERAWIHVLDHPYFAVTGDDGSFEIRGLPPGEYRVTVWHEVFRENAIEPPVRVEDGAGVNLELTFEVPKR